MGWILSGLYPQPVNSCFRGGDIGRDNACAAVHNIIIFGTATEKAGLPRLSFVLELMLYDCLETLSVGQTIFLYNLGKWSCSDQ